jgi:hypothetical protein
MCDLHSTVFFKENTMKTKKPRLLALFALLISCGLIIFGCSSPDPEDNNNNNNNNNQSGSIDFTVAANTPSGKNTDKLVLTFTREVASLSASDITIFPTEGITKGTLSGSGIKWELPVTVSGFANTIACTVTINRSGINSTAKTVNIENNEGKIDYKAVSEKVASNNTTKLTVTFVGRDFDLKTDHIVITSDTSSTTPGYASVGGVTGSGKIHDVSLTSVTPGGITLKINNEKVNDTAKAMTLSRESTSTTPPPDPNPTNPGVGEILEMEIIDNHPTYSKSVSGLKVEYGFPKKLGIKFVPSLPANERVEWITGTDNIITVNQTTGEIKAIANNTGTATILAKAKDGSGVGDMKTITVVKRIIPTMVKIESNETDYYTLAFTGTTGATVPVIVKLGDNDLTFTVELSDGTFRTNDQIILKDSDPSNFFTITPTTSDVSTDDVPILKYKITTKSITDSSREIAFWSNYAPGVKVTLEVEVTYTAMGTPTFLFADAENAPPASWNSGTINFSDRDDPIYVKIVTDQPYSSITTPNEKGFTNTSSGRNVTITATTKKNVFKIAKTSSFLFSRPPANIEVYITDANNKKNTVPYPFQVHNDSTP